ncbi:USP domain-containing protein [Plasmodiophora brassicae]|nr:hypothetical protein PBRA_002248 [Plasmodiophora brassicae]
MEQSTLDLLSELRTACIGDVAGAMEQSTPDLLSELRTACIGDVAGAMEQSTPDLLSELRIDETSEVNDVATAQVLSKMNDPNSCLSLSRARKIVALSDGDAGLGIHLLSAFQMEEFGILADPQIAKLQGIQHDTNSCYLNAVLFSMFAADTSYDSLLTRHIPTDSSRDRLRRLLLVIVNIIRAGVSVPRAIVHEFRLLLVDCRFLTADEIDLQMDAFEFFGWLLDTLDAPFLAMAETLHHGADADSSVDARMSHDRCLEAPVTGTSSLTEILFEHLFGGTVRVRRQHEHEDVDVTALSTSSLIPERVLTDEQVHRFICQDRNAEWDEQAPMMIPIILKRYSWDRSKNRARVEVPCYIDASRFTIDASAFVDDCRYMLVLKSAVCHLGGSLTSGHYITFVRYADGNWFSFDDMADPAVTPVEDVDEACETHVYRDAYILMYELIDLRTLPDYCQALLREAQNANLLHRQANADISRSFQSGIRQRRRRPRRTGRRPRPDYDQGVLREAQNREDHALAGAWQEHVNADSQESPWPDDGQALPREAPYGEDRASAGLWHEQVSADDQEPTWPDYGQGVLREAPNREDHASAWMWHEYANAESQEPPWQDYLWSGPATWIPES